MVPKSYPRKGKTEITISFNGQAPGGQKPSIIELVCQEERVIGIEFVHA